LIEKPVLRFRCGSNLHRLKQNEITSISGATTPTLDANGNMTTDETGKQFVYDAWNRLKIVKDSSGNVLKTYQYDAMNHRVAETVGSNTTDLYYSSGWQVLEERLNGSGKYRYVWSPVYVDAMLLRDRLDASERLWVQHDANFNVTAITDNSGNIVERFAYDPYGKVTVMNASWTPVSGSAYGWQYLHQGGRLDATSGLHNFRHRDYSSQLSRWATPDPLLFSAGDTNLYRVVGNNRINRLDPSGLIDPYNIADYYAEEPFRAMNRLWGRGGLYDRFHRNQDFYRMQEADGSGNPIFQAATHLVIMPIYRTGQFVYDVYPTATNPDYQPYNPYFRGYINGESGYASSVFHLTADAAVAVPTVTPIVSYGASAARAGIGRLGRGIMTGIQTRAEASPWTYGNFGNSTTMGECSWLGDIAINPNIGPGLPFTETLRHEAVHRFFSPTTGPMPIRQIRANLKEWSYWNSHLIRYSEEAMAETVATGSLRTGLGFPVGNTHYAVNPWMVGVEGVGYTGTVGLGGYGAYSLGKYAVSEFDIP
jgi:RHS repeat-associated protein